MQYTVRNRQSPKREWSGDAWNRIKGKPASLVRVDNSELHHLFSDGATHLMRIEGEANDWWMRPDELLATSTREIP